MNNGFPSERFPVLDSFERSQAAHDIARTAISLSELTGEFANVFRIPRLANGRRESDVEHSFMLALTAVEVARKSNTPLDLEKVSRFALVHDLLELKVGDVATFDLTPEQLAEKNRREQVAKQELLSELPPTIATSLEEYEHQDTTEAVFVRTLDKLLPVAVDTSGDGIRVISEDYGVQSLTELIESHNGLHASVAEKFAADFPDLVAAHAVLCEIFEDKYKDQTAKRRRVHEPERGSVEVERKFLVDLEQIPEEIDLDRVSKSHIKQGYIAIGQDGSETRVRSFDGERFELTVKSPGMVTRGEQNYKISKEMFEALWHQTAGRVVEKTRYYIPLDPHTTIELDVYEGHLEGLVTAEVEFSGRQADAEVQSKTFNKPHWFGADVSEDRRYKNHNLSQGKPHEPIDMGKKQF